MIVFKKKMALLWCHQFLFGGFIIPLMALSCFKLNNGDTLGTIFCVV